MQGVTSEVGVAVKLKNQFAVKSKSTKMMPANGLDHKGMLLPKKVLKAREGLYFSAIALSMWDNIHGPKILQVWQGPGKKSRSQDDKATRTPVSEEEMCDLSLLEDTLTSPTDLTDATLLSVANYTLNDEAARAESISGIESKFYSLAKLKLIVYTSIFCVTIDAVKGKTEVFSFMLLLPMSETSEFLARYSFCEMSLQKLLQDFLITPLTDSFKEKRDYARGSVQLRVDGVLENFDQPLLKFTQAMLSLKQNPLPDNIKLTDTYLGKDSGKPDIKGLLTPAITSHIQTSGYTIILGSDREAINKMILTLGLFLSAKERMMSRLVPERVEGEDQPHYEPHLFLQGLVWTTRKSVPFTKLDLYQNKLPHTIIYLDDKHVMMVESKVNVFIGRKEDSVELTEKKNQQKIGDTTSLKEFKDVEKEMSSPLVKEFLSNLWMLNTVGGQRETFIAGFLRLLKLKALALAKYLDTDTGKPVFNLETAAEMLALKPNPNTPEKTAINLSTLQHDLAIECFGDLHVILAFTEKIRPRTYIDVLGDPQLDNLAVINEFASL